MAYEPVAQSQFQPLTSTSNLDCVPCSTAKAIDRSTLGKKRPSTYAVRKATGIWNRGLTYGEAAFAASRVAGVIFAPRYFVAPADAKAIVDGGYPVDWSIDCSVTRYTSRRTGTFTGGHTVYVNDYRWVAVGGGCRCERRSSAVAHGEYRVEDPGNTSIGYQWWSAGLLVKAGLARTNGAGINLLVGLDTERTTRICIGTGYVRSKPTTDPATSRAIARLVVGRSYRLDWTVNGRGWRRADGGTSTAWCRVTLADGRTGYVRGDKLR